MRSSFAAATTAAATTTTTAGTRRQPSRRGPSRPRRLRHCRLRRPPSPPPSGDLRPDSATSGPFSRRISTSDRREEKVRRLEALRRNMKRNRSVSLERGFYDKRTSSHFMKCFRVSLSETLFRNDSNSVNYISFPRFEFLLINLNRLCVKVKPPRLLSRSSNGFHAVG